MFISKENQKDFCIIIPCSATSREEFAASELKKYIHLICGADVAITTDDMAPTSFKILIGGPERNTVTKTYISENEFDALVPGPEGIFLQSYCDCLIVAGSSKNTNECERGTVYAVYELLERFWGCSLAAYSKKGVAAGEHIETADTINLENIQYIKKCADVPYRAAVAQYSGEGKAMTHELNIEFWDWLCKNRYNYIYTWNIAYEHLKKIGMLDEALKRGILFKVGHHDAIDTLLPPKGNKYFEEHYYETHPEYYRLNDDGTRFEIVDHWGQMALCSRNMDMIEQISTNLIEWLHQNPQVKTYALLNKDGTAPQCCCAMCRNYSKVENYVFMINEIAKRVAVAHPDVLVNMLSYTDLWQAPENISLAPNVSVTEATWHISGLRTIGKPDGSTLAGTFYEENLLGWKAIGANVSYYDYFMGVYPGRQRYIPMADEMQAMCKRFVEKGIDGTETQIEVYNLWNNIFNFYTYGRTAYNTDLSLEDNLALFCKLFGKGASYIADNIRYAESVLDGQNEIMTAGIYLMEHIDKNKMYDGFEKALSAADTPLHRNNIRLMRMAFRYSDIETREEYENDEKGYKALKLYTIPERGELLYLKANFDSYASQSGYGIMIPVDGEDNGFTPDKWVQFE
ncbi:MAG: DUF4838 domain-containing protein [Clostridia bacterium]|nr:DUF4838 domain-containing protein [Clostridia bacterium]